jgi:tRNA A37 methylthiotransferase MiaB
MAIQKKISRERLRTFKGRTLTALVEGPSHDNPLVYEARLEGMAPEIDGKVYLTDVELPDGRVAEAGDVADVEIIKTDAYDLVARVTAIHARATGDIAASMPAPAAQSLARIATGAALRVLG